MLYYFLSFRWNFSDERVLGLLARKPRNADKIPKITKKERQEMMKALSIFFQVGITMVICVMLGVFIGRFLDSLLGTTPWLLLLFTFFGAGAAIKFLYDLSKRF